MAAYLFGITHNAAPNAPNATLAKASGTRTRPMRFVPSAKIGKVTTRTVPDAANCRRALGVRVALRPHAVRVGREPVAERRQRGATFGGGKVHRSPHIA